MPNLIGLKEAEAKAVLIQSGFSLRELTSTDPSKPIDVVIAQAPTAGTTRPIGSAVTITINK